MISDADRARTISYSLGPIDAQWIEDAPVALAHPAAAPTPITGKLVADGAIRCRGGRWFAMFKPPGQPRNVLFEIKFGPPITLTAIGPTPGPFFKTGDCDLDFDDVTNELVAFDTCSPDPTTGSAAQAVLWPTGISVAPAGGSSGGGTGAQGPPGPQGATGPAGLKGAAGARGATGPVGASGMTEQQIKDFLWSNPFLVDLLYDLLVNRRNAGLIGAIKSAVER